MTDNLLQKLEEKMMSLLTELETLRNESHRIKQENSALRSEQANHAKKLQGLVSLLDALEGANSPLMNTHELESLAKEEFATA